MEIIPCRMTSKAMGSISVGLPSGFGIAASCACGKKLTRIFSRNSQVVKQGELGVSKMTAAIQTQQSGVSRMAESFRPLYASILQWCTLVLLFLACTTGLQAQERRARSEERRVGKECGSSWSAY